MSRYHLYQEPRDWWYISAIPHADAEGTIDLSFAEYTDYVNLLARIQQYEQRFMLASIEGQVT